MNKRNVLIYLVAFSLAACKGEFETNQEYESLKLKKMEQMTVSEKSYFKSELGSKLKKDQEFVKLTKVQERMALDWFSRDKTKDRKVQRVKPKKFSDLVTYYELRGIQNPQQYARRQMLSIALTSVIAKRYPELKNLDSSTMKEVLKNAGSSSDFKNNLQKRVNNQHNN